MEITNERKIGNFSLSLDGVEVRGEFQIKDGALYALTGNFRIGGEACGFGQMFENGRVSLHDIPEEWLARAVAAMQAAAVEVVERSGGL